MSNIIAVDNLVKRYPGGGPPAVDGVSFAVRRGEFFGFLGPNGAGKTTTLSILCGLLEPTEGNATICGLDLRRQQAEIKQRIGLVPQNLALYLPLSARDNLRFFGRIYGLAGKELDRRVVEALAMVGLADRAGDPVATFSGGMKRRVNLAAGLLHKPEILFLDEPTVGIDPQSRNFLFESLEAMNRDGLTVVYTTHYMEEAQRLCDRVAIIDHGRIVALDAPRVLIDSLGGATIRLSLEGPANGTLASALQGRPGIDELQHDGDGLVLKSHAPQQAIAAVFETATRLDTSIASIQIDQPNLESVFLALTGKRLRD